MSLCTIWIFHAIPSKQKFLFIFTPPSLGARFAKMTFSTVPEIFAIPSKNLFQSTDLPITHGVGGDKLWFSMYCLTFHTIPS